MSEMRGLQLSEESKGKVAKCWHSHRKNGDTSWPEHISTFLYKTGMMGELVEMFAH